MTELVMEKNMVHPFLPAMNAISGLKDDITEAAPVLFGWLDVPEVCQAVEYPAWQIVDGVFCKTVKKVEWALQHFCPPWTTDN